MTTLPAAAREQGVREVRRQALHFYKLGKDKPADHEYNLKFLGLKYVYNHMAKTRHEFNLPRITEVVSE